MLCKVCDFGMASVIGSKQNLTFLTICTHKGRFFNDSLYDPYLVDHAVTFIELSY